MNIYDISKKAGVSIASVSRVINGADNVSEKTRGKVMAIIDKYGYTPNAYAQGLGRGSMRTIGIMCSDSSDIYLANAIYFLETRLRENGYNSILCCTGYDLASKRNSFELLRSRQVDAIIMAGSKFVEKDAEDNAYILEGAKAHPVMLLNGSLSGENIYCTICDDRSGMINAVEKLALSGAQEYVYVYSSSSTSGLQKIEGIREGCRQMGIGDDRLRILKSEKSFEAIADLLEQTYREKPFDAVVTSSDTGGVGALQFAIRNGITVPDKLQILSYNDSILARATNPMLTSVDSRLEDLCSTTVDALLSLLNPETDDEGNAIPPDVPSLTVLNTRLVCRGTTLF